MKTEKMKIERGSGNVFADLGRLTLRLTATRQAQYRSISPTLSTVPSSPHARPTRLVSPACRNSLDLDGWGVAQAVQPDSEGLNANTVASG